MNFLSLLKNASPCWPTPSSPAPDSALQMPAGWHGHSLLGVPPAKAFPWTPEFPFSFPGSVTNLVFECLAVLQSSPVCGGRVWGPRGVRVLAPLTILLSKGSPPAGWVNEYRTIFYSKPKKQLFMSKGAVNNQLPRFEAGRPWMEALCKAKSMKRVHKAHCNTCGWGEPLGGSDGPPGEWRALRLSLRATPAMCPLRLASESPYPSGHLVSWLGAQQEENCGRGEGQ